MNCRTLLVSGLIAGFCVGCGAADKETGASSHETGESGGADDTESMDDGDVSVVVVGVFVQEDDGSYTQRGQELRLEVGVPCATWTRDSPAHGEYTESHPHHNASDATQYADGVVEWTEFGPEHAAADIDAVCAAGDGGVAKHATWDEYTEEQHGDQDPYFLKIIGVESA